jgi:hypothetical protein
MIIQNVELDHAPAYHTSDSYDVSIGGETWPPRRIIDLSASAVPVEDAPWRAAGRKDLVTYLSEGYPPKLW